MLHTVTFCGVARLPIQVSRSAAPSGPEALSRVKQIMKLFKRRAKPDSGTSAASPTEAMAGASTDEVELGQMPDTSVVDSIFQSGIEQAGDSEPTAAPAGMLGRFGMG